MVFFVFNPKTIYIQELYPALRSTLIDALVFFYGQKGASSGRSFAQRKTHKALA
jgi:hypothetical protein